MKKISSFDCFNPINSQNFRKSFLPFQSDDSPKAFITREKTIFKRYLDIDDVDLIVLHIKPHIYKKCWYRFPSLFAGLGSKFFWLWIVKPRVASPRLLHKIGVMFYINLMWIVKTVNNKTANSEGRLYYPVHCALGI